MEKDELAASEGFDSDFIKLYTNSKKRPEQLFHMLPSIGCGFRIIASAMIAEKTVVCSIVTKHDIALVLF